MSDKQELRARHVLADSRAAYDELRQTDDLNVYRRRWVALVTLLRAVGHILKFIDSKRSATHKRVIADHWSKPKPEIFKEFIDQTRSNTIKEYRSGAFLVHDNSVSPMATYDASVLSASSIQLMLSAPLQFEFADGPFKGQSVYTVIEQALAYWDSYLTDVEHDIDAAT